MCRAWERAGIDVVESLRRATTVTNELVYTPTAEGDMRSRLTQRLAKERTVPVVLKDLYEVIDAQPRALAVIKRLFCTRTVRHLWIFKGLRTGFWRKWIYFFILL